MKILEKFSNVLNMDHCNMSVGFFFKFNIGEMAHFSRIILKENSLINYNFTNFGKNNTKSYTYIYNHVCMCKK